ncbi:MAG: hypothetical protein AABY22_11690, partial [Nanoarchaeota archaeon]
MGCDIHCYIEYREKNPPENWKQWHDFGGRINPGRQYGIFAKLVGVRNYYEIEPVSKPRGLPEDLGREAESDNQIYISNEHSDDEGHCSLQKAERWVNTGSSKFIISKDEGRKPKWVTHPDWHSHSWCNADELKQTLDDPKVGVKQEQKY